MPYACIGILHYDLHVTRSTVGLLVPRMATGVAASLLSSPDSARRGETASARAARVGLVVLCLPYVISVVASKDVGSYLVGDAAAPPTLAEARPNLAGTPPTFVRKWANTGTVRAYSAFTPHPQVFFSKNLKNGGT